VPRETPREALWASSQLGMHSPGSAGIVPMVCTAAGPAPEQGHLVALTIERAALLAAPALETGRGPRFQPRQSEPEAEFAFPMMQVRSRGARRCPRIDDLPRCDIRQQQFFTLERLASRDGKAR
jgi:hypothetical protein